MALLRQFRPLRQSATSHPRIQQGLPATESFFTHQSLYTTDPTMRLQNKGQIYLMIYLLTAIGLTSGGSSTVHIYTQAIHRTQ